MYEKYKAQGLLYRERDFLFNGAVMHLASTSALDKLKGGLVAKGWARGRGKRRLM